MPVPQEDWVWCGYPLHFVGGKNCRFHLGTRIGDYIVSTVGDYHPSSAHWDAPAEPIGAGADSLYETYIFRCAGEGTHGEGEIDPTEIEGHRFATSEEACAAHLRYCLKYAKRKQKVKS